MLDAWCTQRAWDDDSRSGGRTSCCPSWISAAATASSASRERYSSGSRSQATACAKATPCAPLVSMTTVFLRRPTRGNTTTRFPTRRMKQEAGSGARQAAFGYPTPHALTLAAAAHHLTRAWASRREAACLREGLARLWRHCRANGRLVSCVDVQWMRQGCVSLGHGALSSRLSQRGEGL